MCAAISIWVKKSGTRRAQIGTPGGATNAITVGSYDWNDTFDQRGRPITFGKLLGNDEVLTLGGLSDYSSPGPSRQIGVVKPELAAPGQYYAAAVFDESARFSVVERRRSDVQHPRHNRPVSVLQRHQRRHALYGWRSRAGDCKGTRYFGQQIEKSVPCELVAR